MPRAGVQPPPSRRNGNQQHISAYPNVDMSSGQRPNPSWVPASHQQPLGRPMPYPAPQTARDAIRGRHQPNSQHSSHAYATQQIHMQQMQHQRTAAELQPSHIPIDPLMLNYPPSQRNYHTASTAATAPAPPAGFVHSSLPPFGYQTPPAGMFTQNNQKGYATTQPQQTRRAKKIGVPDPIGHPALKRKHGYEDIFPPVEPEEPPRKRHKAPPVATLLKMATAGRGFDAYLSTDPQGAPASRGMMPGQAVDDNHVITGGLEAEDSFRAPPIPASNPAQGQNNYDLDVLSYFELSPQMKSANRAALKDAQTKLHLMRLAIPLFVMKHPEMTLRAVHYSEQGLKLARSFKAGLLKAGEGLLEKEKNDIHLWSEEDSVNALMAACKDRYSTVVPASVATSRPDVVAANTPEPPPRPLQQVMPPPDTKASILTPEAAAFQQTTASDASLFVDAATVEANMEKYFRFTTKTRAAYQRRVTECHTAKELLKWDIAFFVADRYPEALSYKKNTPKGLEIGQWFKMYLLETGNTLDDGELAWISKLNEQNAQGAFFFAVEHHMARHDRTAAKHLKQQFKTQQPKDASSGPLKGATIQGAQQSQPEPQLHAEQQLEPGSLKPTSEPLQLEQSKEAKLPDMAAGVELGPRLQREKPQRPKPFQHPSTEEASLMPDELSQQYKLNEIAVQVEHQQTPSLSPQPMQGSEVRDLSQALTSETAKTSPVHGDIDATESEHNAFRDSGVHLPNDKSPSRPSEESEGHKHEPRDRYQELQSLTGSERDRKVQTLLLDCMFPTEGDQKAYMTLLKKPFDYSAFYMWLISAGRGDPVEGEDSPGSIWNDRMVKMFANWVLKTMKAKSMDMGPPSEVLDWSPLMLFMNLALEDSPLPMNATKEDFEALAAEIKNRSAYESMRLCLEHAIVIDKMSRGLEVSKEFADNYAWKSDEATMIADCLVAVFGEGQGLLNAFAKDEKITPLHLVVEYQMIQLFGEEQMQSLDVCKAMGQELSKLLWTARENCPTNLMMKEVESAHNILRVDWKRTMKKLSPQRGTKRRAENAASEDTTNEQPGSKRAKAHHPAEAKTSQKVAFEALAPTVISPRTSNRTPEKRFVPHAQDEAPFSSSRWRGTQWMETMETPRKGLQFIRAPATPV